MTKKKDPDILEDGEEWKIENGFFTIECCDCKLVHRGTIYKNVKGGGLKPITTPLVLRLFRDDKATDQARKSKIRGK